ncbi:ATP-binding cassette domain-containing protein [Streptomyces sp. NPDC002920]
MIEAVGLTKRYGDKTAVHNLSFQVRPGAVTGFLGPNGSGKSTTMRMILGLDNPTAGSVTIGGFPYRRLPNAARQVGALLDAKAVHGGRHARNHLLCLAQLSGIPERRVDEVLGVVGLQDVARRRSKGFSLGMGQRLGIAAALLGDPQVLLFDEPVNGLDPEGILWVRNLMKSLAAEGRTVFVSSHLMSEMALTADHLIVIGRGQLLSDMSVQDFIAANSAGFARVRTPHTEPQLREKLAAALTEAGGHVLPEQDGALRITGLALPRISDIAHDSDVRLWELSPHQASLEEAYMRMTQAAVDYRSTIDQKAGLQQPMPPGFQPPMPVPGQGQPGWYAPPPPQHGYAPPQPAQGPYGAPPPGANGANPYAQPPSAPAAAPAHPAAAPAPQPVTTPTTPATAPQDRVPAAPAQAPAASASPAPAARAGDTATQTFGTATSPVPTAAATPAPQPVAAPSAPQDRLPAPADAPQDQAPASLAKAGVETDAQTSQPEDAR